VEEAGGWVKGNVGCEMNSIGNERILIFCFFELSKCVSC